MLQTIRFCFAEFAAVTRLPQELYHNAVPWLWLLLILGAAACFFGFFVYRAYFSAALFCTVAYVGCVLLSGSVRWGAVVTCFSVLGVALALLGYGWNRLGGFLLSALFGAWIGWSFYPSLIFAAVIGLICGVMLLWFPIVTLGVLTSVFGGWLFWDTSAELFGFLRPLCAIEPLAVGVTALIGFVLQLFMSRKQILFKKTCPDRVRYWIEKRRAALFDAKKVKSHE